MNYQKIIELAQSAIVLQHQNFAMYGVVGANPDLAPATLTILEANTRKRSKEIEKIDAKIKKLTAEV